MPINLSIIYLILSISWDYLWMNGKFIHSPQCLIIFATTENITFFVPDKIIAVIDGYIFLLFFPITVASLYDSTCFRFSSSCILSLSFICEIICFIISAIRELLFCTFISKSIKSSLRKLYQNYIFLSIK